LVYGELRDLDEQAVILSAEFEVAGDAEHAESNDESVIRHSLQIHMGVIY